MCGWFSFCWLDCLWNHLSLYLHVVQPALVEPCPKQDCQPPDHLPLLKEKRVSTPHAYIQEAKRRLTSKQKVEPQSKKKSDHGKTQSKKKSDQGKTTTKKKFVAKTGAVIAVVREALMHGHVHVDNFVGGCYPCCLTLCVRCVRTSASKAAFK